MPEPASRRPRVCVIRGGGDLATGVAWRLWRAGCAVIVTELAAPLAVRRSVSLSSAVGSPDGLAGIEGMTGRLASDPDNAIHIAESGEVAVLVSPELPPISPDVVVDARLAKVNLGTRIDDAPLVVALGPGFVAGSDCDAVVETKRGHRLGRLLWEGAAAPNTGVPGIVAGRGAERVLRAPSVGPVRWSVSIGDLVTEGERIGTVAAVPIYAPFDGLVRGLIQPGIEAKRGLKIGDIDPRPGAVWDEISDKALSIGGGVLEALTTWLNQST